jgi:glycosyltransferase involved in cell wall biosynthesis
MDRILNNKRKPSVAAIIPTYNEERNVAGVLQVLRDTDMLDEIIIVDDGSVDKTIEIVRAYAAADPRMKVIVHEANRGKGQAIFTGWAATTAPCLLLLDADLHQLTPNHISDLLGPVLNHRRYTLGLFWRHIHTDFSH